MNRRVVITGMAGVCASGMTWDTVRDNLLNGVCGIRPNPEYAEVEGLKARLAARIPDFQKPAKWPRRKVRSMGRVSLLACQTTQTALEQAGLEDSPLLGNGRLGIAFGSTSGSPPAVETYARQIGVHKTLHGITAAQFVRLMSHTCAANLAQFFEVCGRIIPTCSACTSGSQGIGYAYETVKWGLADVMIAGGAEEHHEICTSVFDIMNATSGQTDPAAAPKPFDKDRDGLVVGEGSATLILESLDHARARDAVILGEIVGFATNGDGRHIVNPSREDMARVQREALNDAQLEPADIGYVCAHGTATDVGDVAESHASADVFGNHTPISSLKSYMGHALGACGALEAWITLGMLREGFLIPNLKLDQVDPACAPLDYLREVRATKARYAMSNNFAFGGVNTSLVLASYSS